jgi:hypothetical protein
MEIEGKASGFLGCDAVVIRIKPDVSEAYLASTV